MWRVAFAIPLQFYLALRCRKSTRRSRKREKTRNRVPAIGDARTNRDHNEIGFRLARFQGAFIKSVILLFLFDLSSSSILLQPLFSVSRYHRLCLCFTAQWGIKFLSTMNTFMKRKYIFLLLQPYFSYRLLRFLHFFSVKSCSYSIIFKGHGSTRSRKQILVKVCVRLIFYFTKFGKYNRRR